MMFMKLTFTFIIGLLLASCSVAMTTSAYILVFIALGPHPFFFKILNAISGLLDCGGGGGGVFLMSLLYPFYSESFQIHLGSKWDIKNNILNK